MNNCNNKTNNLISKVKDEKKMKIYSRTPFSTCILRPSVSCIRKEIIIDNSEIKAQGKFNNFMLANSEYTLLILGDGYSLGCIKTLGNKRKFYEAHFMNLNDYQYGTYNVGAELAKSNGTFRDEHESNVSNLQLVQGVWGSEGVLIFIKKDSALTTGIADKFEESLKSGALAVAYGPCGLFRNNGLCFIFWIT